MENGRTPDQKQRGLLAEVLTAGITFPICVLSGYWIGSKADRAFGIAPFGLLAGVLLGLAAALVPVFRLSAAWDRIEREKKRNGESGRDGPRSS